MKFNYVCPFPNNIKCIILYLLQAAFGLVYLFIHSVPYVTMDTSITDYNLQHIL